MKIAFLSRYQNKLNRGSEIFVKELSEKLQSKFEVDILSGSESDSFGQIISGNYQIVIPMNGGMQAVKASVGRLFKKYKLVISGQAGVGRTSIFNLLVAPDIFVALTDHMAKWVKRWAWKSKVVKIPNGVDLNKFNPQGEKITFNLPRPVIVSVGALVWYKHHERVIKAVRQLGEGSVLIVGAGEEKDKLKNLGRDFLGNRLKIVSLKYEDMPKVYRSCDLFTLPSWDREAFGIAYLEALASGLGVVAPDDSQRREIIGEAGLFVDVTNPQKYAQAISQALQIDWSKKARAQAEKFSWDKIAKDYEKIILV